MALIPWPADADVTSNPVQLQHAQAVQTSDFTLDRVVTGYGGVRWRGQALVDAKLIDELARVAKRGEIDRLMSRLANRQHWTEVPHGRPVGVIAGDGAIAAQDIVGDRLQLTLMAAEAGLVEGQWLRLGNRSYVVDEDTSDTIKLLIPGIIGTGSNVAGTSSIRAIMTPGQATPMPWSGERKGPAVLSWDEYLGD